MKKLSIIFLLLFFIPTAFADWFYNSENVIVDIGISSYADIQKTSPSGYIEKATVNLTFFPKDTGNQEIADFDTYPEADVTEKNVKFTWTRPQERIDFRIDAEVRTSNTIPQIREKIRFPIETLPKDVEEYTKPTETIDSGNEDIIRLASELVKGEDDLYVAVFKVADWTKNNINYNLSTLTAEVSQRASWVLENRQGVCDELTSLFIAMLRAVGIPARFVSGISYTNSELFPENWGAHGWAEVYFPNYGWVPFDVTYGEFGWVDPTHVIFKQSADSDEPSTYYQWLGRNAELETKKLDVKTSLISYTGIARAPLHLESSILKQSVSFGSYNLIEATLQNNGDFYYATELYLTKPKELKAFGKESKSILLLPNEKKKAYWILKIDENLDKKYAYTFPLVVSTTNNITSKASFESSIRESYVSLEEVQEAAKLLEEETEKKYSGNVLLGCNVSKSEIYEYEETEVYCTAKNTGNVFLEDLQACFEISCKEMDLGIAQTKNFAFKIENQKSGVKEVPVTLRNNLVSKAAYISYKVNDEPKIEIEELEYPKNVSYEQKFTVSFAVAAKSISYPKNVRISFVQNGIEKSWFVEELKDGRKFALNIDGSQLKYGKNDYSINVDYSDGLGRSYKTDKEFSIELPKATLVQRAKLSMNRFGTLSPEAVSITLLAGTIAFIGVVLWLFRKIK